MNKEHKLLTAILFSFIIALSGIPFTSIARASLDAYSDYNEDYYGGIIKKYELPKGFNQPTEDHPWPDEIIPDKFPLRDDCLNGKNIPYKYLTKFRIHAIEVDIAYNRNGFHDPDGRMYVLEEDKDKVLEKVANSNATNGETVTEVQPLAIRTNIGKCVEIEFTNDLREEYASIHPSGIGLDPIKSDGSFVGFNKDSTAKPGETIKYRWFPDVVGANFFSDAARQIVEVDTSVLGDWAANAIKSLRQHGLFGVLIVEQEDAYWTDPFTGKYLRSGVKADIHYNDGIKQDTREFVAFYHDEAGVVDAFGNPTISPNGEIEAMYTMNYRGDTIDSRTNPKFPNHCNPGVAPEVCTDPDFFYNSWPFGDPGNGDLVFPAYSGDPVRLITVGAQTEENHVHHLHEHRWKADPSFGGGSPTIDVQTVGVGNEFLQPVNLAFGDHTINPDTTFAQALIAGAAGYQTGAKDDEHFTGDVIFHCHLFPHYGNGMWSLMRVLDRITSPFAEIVEGGASNGGNALQPVEGAPILLPLPDSTDVTPVADDFLPGFPYFIESNEDGSPKRPPDEQNPWGRDYTDLEWRSTNYYQRAIEHGDPHPDPKVLSKPGAPYDDNCIPGAPERHYDIAAITANVKYNEFGHHDPDGRIFVLVDEIDKTREAILNGDPVEPLIIRAALGECVTTTFINMLDPEPGFNQSTTLSNHIHFVGFDVLGSDGVDVGYDYFQASRAPDTANEQFPDRISYRYMADEEGTIFFHDHITGIEKGMHGTGAMLVVEPKNSVWLDSETGEELECPENCPTSSEIMVVPNKYGNFEPHREFVILYQDFNELYDENGDPIMMMSPDLDHINADNPPSDPNAADRKNVGAPPPGSFHDHGVMSINYRNEPLWERIQDGKPNGDEPAFIFSSDVHGDPSTHIFKAYANDPIRIRLLQTGHEEMHNFVLNGLHPTGFDGFVPPFLGQQAQTIGVAEQFTFDLTTPISLTERNDYMYSSFATNDIFAGMWGLIRVWCNENSLYNDQDFQNVNLAPLPGIKPVKCIDVANNNMNIGENVAQSSTDQDTFDILSMLDTSPNVSTGDSNANTIANEMEEPTISAQQVLPDEDTSIPPDTGLDDIPLESIDPDTERAVLLSMDDLANLRQMQASQADFTPPSSAGSTAFTEKIKPATGLTPISLQDVRNAGLLPPVPNSCSQDAEEKIFDVVAIKKDIITNKYQDTIPEGILFVLKQDLAKIQSGEKPLEPLVIRANVGDCVVVNLENKLPKTEIQPHEHPLQPGECNEHVIFACLDPNEWHTSNRVSLHADNVFYDVGRFDGTNIGFNPIDQTVGPDETITYKWQAVHTGINVLTDMGDLRGHRHHGAYGMLIIEPEGAKYYDINTYQPIQSGAAADIVVPYGENFREFGVAEGDSHYIVTTEDPELCILPVGEEDPPNTPCNQSPINDPEDQGFPVVNYRSAPFIHRLIEAQEQLPFGFPPGPLEFSKIVSQLQSSLVHGDPDTPILKSPVGKPTVIRLADVGDSPRGKVYHLAGHLMERPAPITIAESDIPPHTVFKPYLERGTTDQLSASRSYSLELVGGAGGLQDKIGDYLYQDQKLARYVEGGLWGILRVFPEDFEPIYELNHLINNIEYSKLSPDVKEKIITNLQNILSLLEDTDKDNNKIICEEIIPDLLRFLDELGGNYKSGGDNYNMNYGYPGYKTEKQYDDQKAGYITQYATYAEDDDYSNDKDYNKEKNYEEHNSNYNSDDHDPKQQYDNNEKHYGYGGDISIYKIQEIIRTLAYVICP
ncbi:MAG: hypothetical protein MRJ93_02685 [Nitrososphaeraceae archaeon]|nr:hypothetical protein [Nitrososphaeraceae archaeon]